MIQIRSDKTGPEAGSKPRGQTACNYNQQTTLVGKELRNRTCRLVVFDMTSVRHAKVQSRCINAKNLKIIHVITSDKTFYIRINIGD